MKRAAIAFFVLMTATALLAHDHGKSCDMGKGKGQAVSLTGKVACAANEDCTFQTADASKTYTVCEMSKADLPKLSSAGSTVKIEGKLITCEGKEKLLIEKVAE